MSTNIQEILIDDIQISNSESQSLPTKISYESLINDQTKLICSSGTESIDQQLNICDKSFCHFADITEAVRQKIDLPEIDDALALTEPILRPLWQSTGEYDNKKKVMYQVSGTPIDIDEYLKQPTETTGDETDAKPKIIYKVMPNTHAHVIKYVLSQDVKPIDDQDIVEIVDAIGDDIHTIQLNGNTASLVKTNIAESNEPLLSATATMSDDDDEYQNSIPLAKVPLSSGNKVDENSSRYKITKLEKRVSRLEVQNGMYVQRLNTMEMEINKLNKILTKLQNKNDN